MDGTCLSAGQRDCRRLERGEGVVFTERASSNIEVAFTSSNIDVSDDVVDVGEREGGCRVRGKVLVGVEGTGVPAADDERGGSLESTEVKG